MLIATELEQRLLQFVRESLAPPDLADIITADTRLFEDRVIDSLRVLELIAFLQSELGRKIPDSQIVLANFRSIATIAHVFAGGGSVATTRTQSRSARGRTNGDGRLHLSGGSGAAELLAGRELELTPDGKLIMRGVAASLRDYFDSTVRGWALELGATDETFPAGIPLSTLERAGFTTAFPQKLVLTERPGDESALPPAVCYHHYPTLANSALAARGSVVTAIGRCYRNEFLADSSYPLERLRSFTMREIIAVGGLDLVERLRTGLIDWVSVWMKELALKGHIEIANDPFFTSETRGRMLMQRMLPLKYELRLQVHGNGRSVAAASFNNHEQHFGRAFSIRLPSGAHAFSGCVAFGWERWVIAFISQHGTDQANWPSSVRTSSHLRGNAIAKWGEVAANV